jgi:hypothetical protein
MSRENQMFQAPGGSMPAGSYAMGRMFWNFMDSQFQLQGYL